MSAKKIKPTRDAIHGNEPNGPHRLRPDIIQIIKKDQRLQGRLMSELNLAYATLWRWLKANDMRMTTYDFLYIVWLYLVDELHMDLSFTDLLIVMPQNSKIPES